MNKVKIIPFEKNHSKDIAPLFPEDWHFDFEKFINTHFNKNYFKGFTLLAENQNIGFGNLFVFGKSAWLGNIVVNLNFRGKGYGTLITDELINSARKGGVETCNLIATALGQPIYEKLGFKKELNYDFYSSSQSKFNFETSKNIRKASTEDFKSIQRLDFQVTGENRIEMLEFYWSAIYVALKQGEVTGYFIDALETGSIISIDKVSGLELLKMKLNNGNTKIIIPENNHSLKEFLVENGFEKKLSLPKMILGKRYLWRPENIYNRGAGYCG